MNPTLVLAERMHAARSAIAAFRRAGLLGEEAAEKGEALFLEPGPHAGPVGRILAALFVSGAIVMFAFFAAQATGVRSVTGLAFVGCALLVVATEMILAAPRFAFSGAAGTAGFWAWVAFVTFVYALLEPSDAVPWVALPLAALAAFAAAWRWGLPLHAFLGAAAFFGWLARFPQGRLLWVVVALAAAALLGRVLDRPEAPSHREALVAALGTALGGLYLALNLWSVTEKAVEEIGGRHDAPGAFWVGAAWMGTFLVPLAVLAWGVRTRRRWLLGLGGAFAALSAVTLRRYVHVAPLWELLTPAGIALALLALGLIRALGKRGELRGFTDAPLLTRPGRGEALGAVALVASQLPSLHPPAARPGDGSRFDGGGGSSGGGGASDSF